MCLQVKISLVRLAPTFFYLSFYCYGIRPLKRERQKRALFLFFYTFRRNKPFSDVVGIVVVAVAVVVVVCTQHVYGNGSNVIYFLFSAELPLKSFATA